MSLREDLAAMAEEMSAFQEALEAVAAMRDSPIRAALLETLAGLMFGDEGYTLTEKGREMLGLPK